MCTLVNTGTTTYCHRSLPGWRFKCIPLSPCDHFGYESGMPYGLQIMLSCLPACIHNDNPLSVLDLDSSFSIIKEKLKKYKYIENIIEEKLIKNNHRINYALIPDTEFNNKNEEIDFTKLNYKQYQGKLLCMISSIWFLVK